MALPTASDNPFTSLLVTEGSAPSSPASGKQRLYVDSSDHLLKLKNSSGTVSTVAGSALASHVGCRVTNSGNVAIAASAVTVVTWDTETWDTDGFHSTVTNTGRMTIPSGKDGKYQFLCELQWAANASDARWMALYKNGSIYQVMAPILAGSTTVAFDGAQPHLGSAFAIGAATDYFEVRVWQASGGSINITTLDAPSSFTCTFLGV